MVKKIVAISFVALALLLVPSTGDAYENCNGIGYFALQVPDPGSMVADGNGSDWGWYPADFVIGADQMCETLSGTVPALNDFDAAIRLGWAPEPANRLYVLVTVFDDTLNLNWDLTTQIGPPSSRAAFSASSGV